MAALTPCEGTSVIDARRWATGLLATSSETPRLDAEVLLAHVLGMGRTALVTDGGRCLSPAQAEQFTGLVRRRLRGEPVAYLTGRRAFFDLELMVDARVLIPRPETELLLETALAWAQKMAPEPLRVVDVGTGSGALAIAVARHLERSSVLATDLSVEALQVAAANLAVYGLFGRIALVRGDLLTCVRGPVEVIVSNPPYVPRDRLPTLSTTFVSMSHRWPWMVAIAGWRSSSGCCIRRPSAWRRRGCWPWRSTRPKGRPAMRWP